MVETFKYISQLKSTHTRICDQ